MTITVSQMGAGMTGQSLLGDPEHWRARAEEARILARQREEYDDQGVVAADR